MSINNEGMIIDHPKETIDFEVEYYGKRSNGTAKGEAMPFNTYFDVWLSGNSFSIEAKYTNGIYEWHANSGGTPMVELASQIGKEIEKHFGIVP